MRSYLPDEISAAIQTLRASVKSATPTPSIRARYLAFYLTLFAFGAWCGVGLWKLELLSIGSSDVWRTLLTVLSVLTGFMITTMLFTGKVETAKSLTLEQLDQFCQKSNHLLVSQFSTLLSHVGGIATLAAMITVGTGQYTGPFESLIPLTCGFAALSLTRSLLIPLQIIELHRFTHAALLAEKRSEIAGKLPS